MLSLRTCITSIVNIKKKSLDRVLSKFREDMVSKGPYFLEPGTFCRKMAFIETGYLRMFDVIDGKEITIWIGGKGQFITSLSSFVFQTPNRWSIQAITDCKLYTISRRDHFDLSEKELKWLEFDNLLLARSFSALESSLFLQLHTTARQRMEILLEQQPHLFNEVPLQYIASIIGVTPESLSRLRKG